MFSMMPAVTTPTFVVSLVGLGFVAMSSHTSMRLFTRFQLFSPPRQR